MKITIIFISLLCESLCFLLGSASKCITPEMKCPNVNITFWLYTRKNRDHPVEIKADDAESISKAPWVKDAPIKVLIHGYTGHRDFSPNTEIRPVYLDCCDYNIITVDYNPITLEPCYLESARNTELVGMCLAQLIDAMVGRGFKLVKFHIIGFSLGGQIAGFVSNHLQSGKPERITAPLVHPIIANSFIKIPFGPYTWCTQYSTPDTYYGSIRRKAIQYTALDPALPLFATKDNRRKIDASDANFVDVLHTNALQRGKLETCGVADFFANSGMQQPGCKNTKEQSASSCAHARAPAYYAESIVSSTGFYGARCSSWLLYVVGWCQLTTADEVLFGEHVSYNTSGVFFFSTNSEPPYAKGSTKARNT